MMINSFKQYIVEEAKTLYFTFGRMNPPTIGHEKLLEVLSSKSGNNPYRIYLSQTNDKKKNPLLYNDKVKYARKMMPKHARYIMLNKDVKTVFDAANAIYNEGFVNVVMVVGSDRITEFKSLLTKYNGKTGQRYGFYNFRTIDVISAGERDPDSEGVDGMSASKMRAAAGDNDFNQFTKGLPKNFSNKDSKDLFNGVRSGMGLKEETEFYKHVQLESVGDIREKYIQGEIYNLGERLRIKDTDELAEVTFRGPNYLILEKEDGSIVRKWIEAVESLDEAVKKVATPKWKKSGPNGEKEITFSTGRRFQIEKQYDQDDRHKGEWKVMEWNTRSRDWDWHETYSPQWHAKAKVIELGKYDSKGKKVTESIESVNEDPTQLAHDAVTSAEMLKGLGILGTGAVIKYGITDPLTKVIHKKITNTVDKFKADRKRKRPVITKPIPRDMKTEDSKLDNYNKTGWGTKESTKKWVDATPGQVMPDVKPTPKSKTKTRKHPGSDVSDAGGMGEGAMKRSGPDMDGYAPGGNKATISYDKIDKGLKTYRKKPDDLVTKIKIARKGAKLILGDKRDGK
tara:strand:- start:472 stop:2175 length:1704 start_codon:yes stop_codon:yes gene_type:complete